jgi:hypothetical protein
MKNARMVVSSILVIGLLATSAVTVAAQDDDIDELTAVSYVTGTLGDPIPGDPGTDSPSGGLLEHRGYIFAEIPVETDDPRLTGSMTLTANGDERFFSGTIGPGEYTDIQVHGVRITNDEGGWSGQGTTFRHGNDFRAEGTATTDFNTVILAGDGAYEGLTAYVLIDGTTTPASLEGTIFQGVMPPFPESATE